MMRKEKKMGDILNIKEFIRKKERVGRIRLMEKEEEKRLLEEIK